MSDLQNELAARKTRMEERTGDTQISRWLNFSFDTDPSGETLLYHLGFEEAHIGNPVLRALHGGVISCFLEYACLAEVYGRLSPGDRVEIISTHTNYFRSAIAADMTARVEIRRTGRRVAFAEATGWQDSPDKPVARSAVSLRLLRAADDGG